MLSVLVPIALMLVIVMCRKIPVIGGRIEVGLLVAGLSALILGGVYNPVNWLVAWLNGVDTIAWTLFLTLFGSIYAQTQIEMGSMETMFMCFQSQFGTRPRAISVCIVITLIISGAILGGGTPSIAIVGVLMIPSMVKLGMSPTQICSTLVMGGSLGSLMPPVSQAITLSSSLVSVDVDQANLFGYFSVGSGVILACIYVAFRFVNKNAQLLDVDENGNVIQPPKVSEILKERWVSMVPFILLIILILLRTLKIIDIVPMLLNMIKINGVELLTWVKDIHIIRGFSNVTVDIIIVVTLLTYLFPQVRKTGFRCVKNGAKNSVKLGIILLLSGLMLGAFQAGGQIEVVREFAAGLNINVLIIGGAFAMVLLGMLVGTQSTPNNTIFSFFGPSLVDAGIAPGRAAMAGASFAAAGQGMPPADTVTFFTAGLVTGVLGEPVDPLKAMFYSAPVWSWIILTGLLLLYTG